MVKKIRDILQSGFCLSDFNDKCKNDGACRKCEDEALEKLIAEHDAELIDKFVELFKSKTNMENRLVDEIAKIVKGAEE